MLPLGDGAVTLSATAEEISASDGRPGLEPGAYVRIAVSDTGIGMDAATAACATEFFFTTKAPGAGTGLGLAMAREVADRAHGALYITSTVGAGTTVTLWLPQARPLLTPQSHSPAGSPPLCGVSAPPAPGE